MKFNQLNLNLKKLTGEFFSRVIIQITFPPLMLFFMGKENFDRWLFIFAIPSFFSIFQISISSPIRNHMQKLLSKKKFSQINEYYQNTFYFTLMNILLILTALSVYLILNFNNEFIKNNLNLIFIAYFSLFINLINGNFYCALTYKGSLDKYLNIEIVFNLLIHFLIPFCYYVSSFEITIYTYLFINIIKTFIFVLFINDKHLNILPFAKFFNTKIIISIFKLSFGFNLDILSKLIKGPGLIFIIGTANINLVSTISTLKTMFYFFPFRFFLIFEKALFIDFVNFFSSKKNFMLYKKRLIKMSLGTICLIILFLFLNYYFGEHIYNYWTNNNFVINKKLIVLISIDISILIMGSIIAVPLKSTNKYSLIGLVEFAVNLLLFLFLFLNKELLTLEYVLLMSVYSSIIIFISKFLLSTNFIKKYESKFK